MTLAASTFRNKNGFIFNLKPLAAEDGAALGRYFEGLSAETRGRFGPHPLDTATASLLCQNLNPQEILRFVAWHQAEIVAYAILEWRSNPPEMERYQAQGIALDPALDCTVAPSVADAYQNQGLGTPMLQALIQTARQQGRRYMVLMGGTQASNARAIHFYEKLGFQHLIRFEYPPSFWNHDMWLTLAHTLEE
jgi:GNAT superfamily N-acetyltransferase